MDRQFAMDMDRKDVLASFRSRFRIPVKNGKEQIYFLGNSLGLQPVAASKHIERILTDWSELGVEGFFEGSRPWMSIHEELSGLLSPIVGAMPSEIVVMNSLTVNLHLMLVSFYQPTGKRKKILCEQKAFPSDQYMLETFLKQRGLDPNEIIIEISPSEGEINIREEDILQSIHQHKDELSLVFFGGVNYYTGQVFNMQAITKAAHEAGALAGFDLAHAAGNIELKLHEWAVDFACWCNYKYLNAGPGAVASAYIHERYHNDPSIQRLGGWWGHEKASRFRMEKGFIPIHDAEGWQLSTPPILLYAALHASLELFAEAGFSGLLKKSQAMGEYLHQLLSGLGDKVRILTPADPSQHGCQVSMYFPENGRAVFDALKEEGVFADWREPNVIRVAPVPLYNTFEEIYEFVDIMKKTLDKLSFN